MLKKICALFCGMAISGCSLLQDFDYANRQFNYLEGPMTGEIDSTDYSMINLGNESSFRVAMLLPLSGKMADMGNSMKNSAMMALGDLNANNLVVQFYDTKGTTSGARIAVENAIQANSNLILGPLLSDEVTAITEPAKSADIPVISFSTAPHVLQNGIYTLGLLSDEQVERIIRYSASINRSNVAMVLPDTPSSINMLRSALNASKLHGVNIVKVGFYAPDTMDFTTLVTQIAGEEKINYSKKLSARAKKTQNANEPEEELEPVELDFNAVLVPEFGNRLKSITSMFSFYDVSAPEVMFLGTSVWANTNLSKETELYGAVYPVMPPARQQYFAQKYSEMFGERPNGLSVLAYDAVALSFALAQKDKEQLHQAITSMDGFFGMSGAFRLFTNGKNEHGLDIVKVSSKGQQVVEPAVQKFYTINPAYAYVSEDNSLSDIQLPQIYGKDANTVRQLLLNVQ